AVAARDGAVGRVIVGLDQAACRAIEHVPDRAELIGHVNQFLPGEDVELALGEIAALQGTSGSRGKTLADPVTTPHVMYVGIGRLRLDVLQHPPEYIASEGARYRARSYFGEVIL